MIAAYVDDHGSGTEGSRFDKVPFFSFGFDPNVVIHAQGCTIRTCFTD